MKLIKKYKHSGEITQENDAIQAPIIKVKPITEYHQEPNSDYIHEVTIDPETGQYAIGVSYPGLTELQEKDKSAVERLYNRPYTNRSYLALQRGIHNSNVRDIQLGTTGAGAIMALANILSGTARFGGNPGITSGGVRMMPFLDPANIAGYANATGYIAADPYNWRTYSNPEVWTAVLPFLPVYGGGITPSKLPAYGTSEDLYNIEKAIVDQQLAALKSNPHSYLSRVLSGEVVDPDYLKAVQQIEVGNYPLFSKVGGKPNVQQLIEAAAQGNENRVYAAVHKGTANYPGRTDYSPRVKDASGVDFGGMVYTTSSPDVSLNYAVSDLAQQSLGGRVMDIVDRSGLKLKDEHLQAIRNKIAEIEQFQRDHNVKQSAAIVERMKKSGRYNIGGYNRGGTKSGQYNWQKMIEDAEQEGIHLNLNAHNNGAIRAEFEKVTNLSPSEMEELNNLYAELNVLLGNQGLSIGGSRAGIVALEDIMDPDAIKVGNFDWNGELYGKEVPYSAPFKGKKSGNKLTRWLQQNGYDVGVIQNIEDPSLGNNVVVRNADQFILARNNGGKLIKKYKI